MSGRIVGYLAATVVCVSFLVVGCEPAPKEVGKLPVEKPPVVEKPPAVVKKPLVEVVDLALVFRKGDSARYKVVAEIDKSIGSQQSVKDESAEDHTGNRLEMTFIQKIESVDHQGNAVARITIERLKYFSQEKDQVRWDFDSSRRADKANKLARLVGQSYKIKISPAGAVEVLDARAVRNAVKSGSAGSLVGVLFSNQLIVKRHEVLSLPEKDRSKMRPGANWSKLMGLDLGMMGAKSYEKLYTLERLGRRGGQDIAIVKMKAVPSAEPAPDLKRRDEQALDFPAMLASLAPNISVDSSDNYKGELVLNLEDGKVAGYYERLEAKWVVVETPTAEAPQAVSNVLTIGFRRFHSVKRLD